MTTVGLLSRLRDLDVKLWVDGESLRYSAPSGTLTPDLRALLSASKHDIVAFLRKAAATLPAIRPVPRGEDLPLSFSQQRLWFIDQLDPGTAAYNIAGGLRLTGRLHEPALEQSLLEIARRHESLRTTFRRVHGRPCQVISSTAAFPVEKIDLRGGPPEAREAEVQRHAREEAAAPFDLSTGPLVRARLLRVSEDERVVLLTMHHIVSDAWSLAVFVRELSALYPALAAGRPSPLPALPVQYADFSHWQRERLTGPLVEEQLEFWRRQLHEVASLELPGDRPRPPRRTSRGGLRPVVLSRTLVERLKRLALQEEATLFMVLLAGFKVLLSRYTGEKDVAVGTPVANRTQGELEGLIGFFVNTLVVRTRLSAPLTFRQLVRRVRDASVAALAHQDLPFEKLVEELQPARDMSRTPLFQVMFVLQNTPPFKLQLPGLHLEPLEVIGTTAKFDLTLTLTETEDGVSGTLEYSDDIFDGPTVDRVARHYVTLLESAVGEADSDVSALSLLSPAERHQVTAGWNDTEAAFPSDLCLHDLFEAQVRRTPDAVAARFDTLWISYRELDRRANRLARHLRKLGVGPESVVGLCLERSLEIVVALLGVLKAGGAYVPLDPSYPRERLLFMLADARAGVLLTQARLRPLLSGAGARVLCLDAAETEGAGDESLPREVGPENAAYVIYTSGSTGSPKGAVVPHRAITNHMLWMERQFPLSASDKVFQKTPFSFDASVWEFYAPLQAGAELVLAAPDGHKDPAYLARAVAEHGITVLQVVPSLLQTLLDTPGFERGTGLRRLFCGGEPLSRDLVRRTQATLPAVELHNLYGPTEAAIDTTFWSARRDGDEAMVPIGRPIANARVYVLDAEMQPLPPGVYGDLYIGGRGLGRGYLHRPELTAERFVPDPFAVQPGARLYNTGDRARFLADGNLEFGGRGDHQVKIRGFRIELGEIECGLREHAAIREAAVVAREDVPGDKRLVAYIVGTEHHTLPSVADLRAFLLQKLPDYMLPSLFVPVDALPMLPSGKLDRKALPAPAAARLGVQTEFVTPRTDTERRVAEIWTAVLRAERVGVHDDFFELGGHSLLATQAHSRLTEAFDVELPLRTLFEAPTVAELALRVDSAQRAAMDGRRAPIPCLPRDGRLPLSFAQQRLWFIDQLEPGNVAYNIPGALHLRGALDRAALDAAFTELVRRHESLRTTFRSDDGEPVQVIAPPSAWVVPAVDLRPHSAAEKQAEIERRMRAEAEQAFDLAAGPLLRTRLLVCGDDEHVLLLTVHHIVSDGWSIGVLIGELSLLYRAFHARQPSPLRALEIQYVDFAAWQRGWLDGARLEDQLGYWRRQLRAVPPRLSLPTDRPRPAVLAVDGGTHAFTVGAETADALRALSRGHGATLFITLLAAFKVLLGRYAGQEDVVVGSPIANRTRPELEELIGFFANTLVLRTDLSGDPTFLELLNRVRETALGAYSNQDVPFERLVEELQPERTLAHTPLFQVMFVLQNAPGSGLELPGLNVRPLAVTGAASKFDMTLRMSEAEHGLDAWLEYNTSLFDEATIRRLARHFQRLLQGVLADPDSRIASLPLMTDEERAEVTLKGVPRRRTAAPEATVHELFERQVRQTPRALAVRCRERSMTFAELNARANRIARRLRRAGVGADTLVGLCLERSVDMVAALLGVLKAGGAYVPIDPTYPKERLAVMMAEAAVPVLVTERALEGRLPTHTAEAVHLDGEEVAAEPPDDVPGAAAPDGLAYVIFTSGSTGRPKGVMIEHRSVLSLLASLRETVYAGEDLSGFRVGLNASLSFDASVKQWVLLAAGAALDVVPEEQRHDGERLVAFLRDHEIQAIDATPAHVEMMMAAGLASEARIPKLVIGGEAIERPLWQQLGRLAARPPWNVYGPTECTVDATACVIRPDEAPHIGRPLPHATVHLLDPHGHVVPVGVPGELYVGGTGVGRGYYRRPDATAERFVPDPFSMEVGRRLFRTGDLARFRDNGDIEFLGRADQQVKIRGFRIELGDIEAALAQHPEVLAAAAAVWEAPGGKQLAAYVVPRSEPLSDLKRFLRERLPEYMVPSTVTPLSRLPLTPSGKLDRRSLPAPDGEGAGPARGAVAPRDAVERELARLWEETLDVRPVGATDDFFDLGGHSLLAVRLMAQIQRQFGKKLPLAALFQAPTVEGLSALLREEQAQAYSPLVGLQRSGSRSPLFLVHPIGGNVLCYSELSRALGAEQPLYGLQAAGLDGEQPPLGRIEDMAAAYLEAVRSVQPEGPYVLGGWSFGGVVAFEMARRLVEAGQPVPCLLFIDSWAPVPENRTADVDEQDPAAVARFVADLARLYGKEIDFSDTAAATDAASDGLDSVLDRAAAHGVVPSWMDRKQVRSLLGVFQANLRALRLYRPAESTYDGQIVLARAADNAAISADPTLGWGRLVSRPVRVHSLRGDHYSILAKPQVEAVARYLQTFLLPPS